MAFILILQLLKAIITFVLNVKAATKAIIAAIEILNALTKL
jgi:hypothetical protein|uniref:Uncharacterized protein n=1 Tax=Myoviridae sp. ctsip2 TaxID=2826705 RepID=A0A8S5N6E7_9CAUD|nr:MAG TPA: hypothetical protein [Myoviridae sp. ctsip2]